MSGLSSFADVRDYALSGEGECCTDDDRLECLIQECLQIFWTQLPVKDRVRTEILTTVKGQASYPLPNGITQVSSPSSGPCSLERRPPLCSPCDDEAKSSGGEPKSFYVEQGHITFDPVPDDAYKITYQTHPELSCDLKAADGVTWLNVPIPGKYHPTFKAMVRAKSVMESDPQRGANLFNMANSSLQLLVADSKKFNDPKRLHLNSDVKTCRCSGQSCRVQTWKHCPFPEEP